MGMRDDVVDRTVENFFFLKDFTPSTTDIRLESNVVGDDMVRDRLYSEKQWERLSQSRTVELVRKKLKKDLASGKAYNFQ